MYLCPEVDSHNKLLPDVRYDDVRGAACYSAQVLKHDLQALRRDAACKGSSVRNGIKGLGVGAGVSRR